MELLKQYIAGLNAAIAAGGDVRFMLAGKSVPAICAIIINEQQRCLNVTYLMPNQPGDQKTQIPVSTRFTIEMNDLPNDLRAEGWR
jgi:hypothetical protein